jgi:O-antigen/teichoic acid export membrane protein
LGARPSASRFTLGRRSPVTTGLAGKTAELVTQALLVTLVPRALGPSDYGTLALVLAVVGVGSSFVTVGGAAVLGRYVPAAPADQRPGVARALAGRLGLLAGALIVVGAVTAAALVAVAPARFPAVLTGLVVLALSLEVAASLASQVALGLGRLTAWTFRYPVQNTVLIVAALALPMHAGETHAGTAVLVSAAAGLVFAGLSVTDVLRAPRAAHVPPGAIRFGALHAVGTVLILLTQRGTVLAAGLLAGVEAAGFAAVAVGAGLTLTYGVTWLFTAQLPMLSERWERDPGGAEAAAGRLASRILVLLVPLTLAGALGARYGLPALVGDDFEGATTALAPALAAAVLAPLVALVSQIAMLRLRPDVRVWSAAAGAGAFIAVVAPAAQIWGAAGATGALLAGTVVTLLVSASMLPNAITRRSLALSLVAACAVLAVGLST